MAQYRNSKHLSQENMAEILHVSLRSYSGQERGEFGFSALSLMFFVCQLDENELKSFIEAFVDNLKKAGKENVA